MGHPDDAFFRDAAELMRECYGIGHLTLQALRQPFVPLCGDLCLS